MAELTRIIDGKKIIIHLTHDELVMIGHEYFDNRVKEDISIYLESKKSGNLSERDMLLITDDFKNTIENCILSEKDEWLQVIFCNRIGKKVDAFG